MIESMKDFEGKQFLNSTGKYVFEIKTYNLDKSSDGESLIAVFEAESDAGTTTIRHSLKPNARWSYNNLIKAVKKLTAEEVKKYRLDYETIGQELIGGKFVGDVVCETYDKEISIPNEDGTFTRTIEKRESYKIRSYAPYFESKK